MKIHKNLVSAIATGLQEIFIKKRYADKVIEELFKTNGSWGSRDRRFIAEGIYEIVRHYRLYAELAGSKNNFWFITGVWMVLENIEIPDWPEFKHLDRNSIAAQKEKYRPNLPLFESYPDWLWELGIAELGKETWEKEALAMNKQAPVFLRVNTLKVTRDVLAADLQKEGIETVAVHDCPDALQLVKRMNVFQNRFFKEGMFEVQDGGSQLISVFLDPKPGERVIDACAGAGGKTLHIAALMQNKGRIISLDPEEWKLNELKKRAKRAGAFNIDTRLAGKNRTISSLESSADKLLLDVPCSGLGVLKRNPDAKWKLSPESIAKTRSLQRDIIESYAGMLKVGGSMVYSTCSILPSENREQVDFFLSNHKNFELIEDRVVYPHQGFDGFYMASLKRLN